MIFGAQIRMQSQTFGYGAGSSCDFFSKTHAIPVWLGRIQFDLAFWWGWGGGRRECSGSEDTSTFMLTHLIHTPQRQNAENVKQIFPEKDYRGLSPNFHIHVSVSQLYISTMGLLFCGRKYVDPSWEYINRSQTHECGNWG